MFYQKAEAWTRCGVTKSRDCVLTRLHLSVASVTFWNLASHSSQQTLSLFITEGLVEMVLFSSSAACFSTSDSMSSNI
ncbi:hypothetical protein EMCRGX_G002001 [Ephydatia muelleri]